MFRYITPIILVGVAVAGFLMFTKPIISDISTIKDEKLSYNEALDNAKALESERDKLTKKYNSIDPDALSRLQKFLPDNVDNIRLILEIERLALPYNMSLKDVKYDSTLLSKKDTATVGATQGPADTTIAEKNRAYGEWTLEFSTEGRYSDFVSFTKDLESNLRIVDISAVVFSSDELGGLVLGKPKPVDLYRYTFKIKTYWLKN